MAAARTSAATCTNQSPCTQAIQARNRQAIATDPLASPFNPSMKFTALVANRIHATVSGTPAKPVSTPPSQGRCSTRKRIPQAIAIIAATTCAPSFTVNDQLRISSA